MISIKKLFETFLLPGKFPKLKKTISITPTMPNRKSISKIKKLNSKLANMTNPAQQR